MKFEIDEIKEIKVVTTDVGDSVTFAYIDQLKDGSWRLVYTKNMEDRLKLIERDDT